MLKNQIKHEKAADLIDRVDGPTPQRQQPSQRYDNADQWRQILGDIKDITELQRESLDGYGVPTSTTYTVEELVTKDRVVVKRPGLGEVLRGDGSLRDLLFGYRAKETYQETEEIERERPMDSFELTEQDALLKAAYVTKLHEGIEVLDAMAVEIEQERDFFAEKQSSCLHEYEHLTQQAKELEEKLGTYEAELEEKKREFSAAIQGGETFATLGDEVDKLEIARKDLSGDYTRTAEQAKRKQELYQTRKLWTSALTTVKSTVERTMSHADDVATHLEDIMRTGKIFGNSMNMIGESYKTLAECSELMDQSLNQLAMYGRAAMSASQTQLPKVRDQLETVVTRLQENDTQIRNKTEANKALLADTREATLTLIAGGTGYEQATIERDYHPEP